MSQLMVLPWELQPVGQGLTYRWLYSLQLCYTRWVLSYNFKSVLKGSMTHWRTKAFFFHVRCFTIGCGGDWTLFSFNFPDTDLGYPRTWPTSLTSNQPKPPPPPPKKREPKGGGGVFEPPPYAPGMTHFITPWVSLKEISALWQCDLKLQIMTNLGKFLLLLCCPLPTDRKMRKNRVGVFLFIFFIFLFFFLNVRFGRRIC